ncbi:putative gtp-binding protein rab2 protein [Eutypa lata UCREL1]|uniref:Putative gtp-binding protein rab2 protein n=1 Tax=Eutypa lata (strain UCR-EL1) TaxID=1287681 RepID=M7SG78_EUTLA|nr:putative gtp-binding protein rab2 protein [Eutypa lata UCREL1]
MSSPPWDYIAKLVCIGDSGCGKSSLTIRLCEGRFSAQHDVTIGVEFGSRIVPVGPPHNKAGSSATFAAFAAADASNSNDNDNSNNAATSSTSSRPSSSTTATAPEGLPQPRRKEVEIPQKHMKLSLWDTAGQETYKSVTRSYFRGASGALLVFDITRRATFLHATDWLSDLRQIAEPDIVVVLVGNKLDEVTPDHHAEEDNENNNNNNKKEKKREVTASEAREWAAKNGVLAYVETSAKSGHNVEAAFAGVAERIFENINAGRYDLNDRRSGVKGPGPGTGGGGVGGGGGGGGAGARVVQLSADAGRSAGGVCC